MLARVGRNSLHPRWVAAGSPRDWDLLLVPYEPIPPEDAAECSVTDVLPGPKWTGLAQLLAGWEGWRAYDHVWMPDDDIDADQDTITRMFDAARALGLDLFAPALHESSYFAHFSTMVNRRFGARSVGFVEIMMPAFSRAALERLASTIAMTETGWGWGLDSVWPKLLGYENVGIIDSTPVVHTRPVGRMRDAELEQRVLDESATLLADHDCDQTHATFRAFDHDLRELPLSPEQLHAELVRGWDYLIERDPRLLAWIAEYQRSRFPPPPYPVEGTPSQGGAAPAAAEAPLQLSG